MASLEDPSSSPGNGHDNGQVEPVAGTNLHGRIRDLEKENARLRGEIEAMRVRFEQDRELLNALMAEGLPRNEVESATMLATCRSIGDVVREFEAAAGSAK